MGVSTSKPDWYPGEPPSSFNAPPCSCSQGRLYTPASSDGFGVGTSAGDKQHSLERCGGDSVTSTIDVRESGSNKLAVATRHGQEGGPDGKAAHDITSLPVVTLTDSQFIANGGFCSVYACKYRGWSVVAKRVRPDLPLAERKAALANLWTEYDCLKPLYHPNIINVYGMCRVRCREDYEDWNEKDVCLLLEQLAFGTVGHLFGTNASLEKNLVNTMARSRKMRMVPFRCRLHRALELAKGLQYVHGGAGIAMMHRDIKNVNVGFAQDGVLKLMDFGLSRIVPQGSTEDEAFKMTGEVGSYRYMAPELVKHEPYNTKVDIYSWAILSWEMLAIDRPYKGIDESTFMKRVVIAGDRPQLPKSWPDRLRKLLASAWHADPTRRPTAAEIVTVLKVVYLELPAKARRRPSHDASAAKQGGVVRRGSRRHSWTQARSGPPCASNLTQLPSRSSGAGGDAAPTTRHKDGGTQACHPTVKQEPFSPSSPSPVVRKSQGRRAKSLTMLPGAAPTSSSSSAAARKQSFLTSRNTADQPVSKGTFVDSALGTKDEEEQEKEEECNVVNDDVEGQAPYCAAAPTTGDMVGNCGTGNCGVLVCPHRSFAEQRKIIVDALMRETDGLSLPGKTRSSLRRRTAASQAATEATVGPAPQRKNECISGPSQSSQATEHQMKSEVETNEAPADALDGSREERRSSSLSKLWPSGSSERKVDGNKARSPGLVPSLAVADVNAREPAVIRTVVSGTTSMNSSGGAHEVDGGNVPKRGTG